MGEAIPGVAADQEESTFPPGYDYGIEVVVNDLGTADDADDTATDVIEGVDPFTVFSFFEVSNKYNNNDDEVNNIADAITVEVYTTVIGEDDCSKGTLIEDDDEFTISAGAVNRITGIDYPSPRNDNTIVGATIVRLTNFMSNVIYVANVANDEEDTEAAAHLLWKVRSGDLAELGARALAEDLAGESL